ncbi:hypothetical protein H696_02383 [Fonticula alba]|uniref:Uncharacterized protein n=1 Tax=Fonticula alba TaxID=691883 RepID=A0A058ZBY1_FONAL|nr:hypothetical protein H696_02383 [Fonticula alba]KCV71436.1 hypothetical protein H696_02383 [Fonticula alba]|eukprot:XP_009494559.1 hypothetical protein H696_02383 [Fonticula alba]
MSAPTPAPMTEQQLKADVERLSQLTQDLSDFVEQRQVLQRQLNECLTVKKEFDLLPPNDEDPGDMVYKMENKRLVSLSLAESRQQLERRLKFLEESSERLEKQILARDTERNNLLLKAPQLRAYLNRAK